MFRRDKCPKEDLKNLTSRLPFRKNSVKATTIIRTMVLVLLVLCTLGCRAQDKEWRGDLEKFYTLVLNESGHIFQNYDFRQWRNDYDLLLRQSDTMSKNEVRVALMALVAKLKDGHSGIWIRDMVFPGNGTKWFPIRMYYFEEGLYIIASDKKYADYVGGKVEQIGALSVSEVSRKLFEISNGENEYGDMFKVPFFMIYPPILAGLGILEDETAPLTLKVRLSNGSLEKVQVNAESYEGGLEDFFDEFQAPSSNSVRLDEKLGIQWPSSKWDVNPPYHLEYLEDKATLYMKLNVLKDPPNHSITDTYTELWEVVEKKEVDKLIVDLRNNGGGNLFNAWPFVFKLRQFPRLNKENKLIVLVGRKTFSAATAFLSMLETHTNAIFIGEPSGGRPNQTEGTPEFPPPSLEHIGVDVLLSRGRWSHTNPRDDREYMAPDILVVESISDWMKGVDRAFDEAIGLK
ncbi:S41 family peptidase [Ulvibacterium sp.]|uniref:S41 family peptidase n=1 Tax=Ulvibacterium sp. TaxID=2665914 RepID=UPI00262907D9|nr:S41 family peptidase [Ulvibacterium sp.]